MWWARLLNSLVGIYGNGGGGAAGSYESISTVSVGSGGQATISFSSIPSTYSHLQLRYLTQDTSGGYFVRLQFNGDSATSSYTSHNIDANGSAVSSGASVTNNAGTLNPRNTTSGSIFTVGIVDILDYTNTNKYKVTRGLGGSDTNGGGILDFTSGVWMNTAAITSITASMVVGNFSQYSHFALYGIKA